MPTWARLVRCKILEYNHLRKEVIALNVDFTPQEILFIYGHFSKEIKSLESLKKSPNCPISKTDINKDIKLYTAITSKLQEAYPQLNKLNL